MNIQNPGSLRSQYKEKSLFYIYRERSDPGFAKFYKNGIF